MRWLRTLAVGVLGLAAAPQASAEDLSWNWAEGESHRYYIAAEVQSPYVLQFNAQANQQLRVAQFNVALNLGCTNVRDVGKKAFELECTIDDARITAKAMRSDAGRGLKDILDEVDMGYLNARVQVVMTRDGHIRSVSLDGVNDRLRRMREMEETMRLMVVRTFAGLDLGLPKKGAGVNESWVDNKALVFQLPSKFGSFGSASLTSKLVEVADGVAMIETEGRANVATGEPAAVATPEGAGADRPRDTFDMVMESFTQFDVARGVVVKRTVVASGTPTASSQTAMAGDGVAYLQEIKVTLADDMDVPTFADNAEIGG